jgi:hypothetical protein
LLDKNERLESLIEKRRKNEQFRNNLDSQISYKTQNRES